MTKEELEKENEKLRKENADLKRDKEDLIFIRNQNAKCMCEDKENLAKAKDIIERLLINRPDTYSGTYVELIQSKMFQFNRAVSDADDFLRN